MFLSYVRFKFYRSSSPLFCSHLLFPEMHQNSGWMGWGGFYDLHNAIAWKKVPAPLFHPPRCDSPTEPLSYLITTGWYLPLGSLCSHLVTSCSVRCSIVELLFWFKLKICLGKYCSLHSMLFITTLEKKPWLLTATYWVYIWVMKGSLRFFR